MGERCPGCGYDLRDADADRCPECGAAFARTLVLRDARAVGWRLALAGLTIALVTDLVLLYTSVAGIIDATPSARYLQLVNAGMAAPISGPNWRWLAVSTVLATLAAAGIGFVLAQRQGWLGHSSRRRRLVTAMVVLAPALNAGLLYVGRLVVMF